MNIPEISVNTSNDDICAATKSIIEQSGIDFVLKLLKEILIEPTEADIVDFRTKLLEWRESLVSDSVCDSYCPKDKKWYATKIISREGERVLIHYQGWNAKFDSSFLLTNLVALPPFCVVKRRKQPVRPPTAKYVYHVEVDADGKEVGGDIPPPKVDIQNSDTVIGTTKSGRMIRAVLESSSSSENFSYKYNRHVCHTHTRTDTSPWLCGICNDFEAFDDSNLIICEGPCNRAFHVGCAGDVDLNADYLCKACKNRRHVCAVCNIDGSDDLDVFLCNRASCGRFYHIACMKDSNLSFENCATNSSSSLPVFSCPAHVCDVCAESGNGVIVSCVYCPRSYHARCIHPACEINDTCLLCPDHAGRKLPDVNAAVNFDGMGSSSFGMSGDGAGMNIMDMATRPQSVQEICDANPVSRHQLTVLSSLSSSSSSSSTSLFTDSLMEVFQVPVRLSSPPFLLPTYYEESQQPPRPKYSHISKLDYSLVSSSQDRHNYNTEKRSDEHTVCDCDGICDDYCLNRLVRVECDFNTYKPREGSTSGFSVNKRLSNMTNCNVAKCRLLSKDSDGCTVDGDCGNQRLSRKLYSKVEIRQEPGRGYGLITCEEIKAGCLITEYIGEVIDDEEMEARLKFQMDTGDYDVYIMELGDGLYVDGKRKGNYSRFINHSCGPNCELQRWTVNGKQRIAVVALQDLPLNSYLSYDYQFATKNKEAFSCRCGSVNCRGTMAAAEKKNVKKVSTKMSIVQSSSSSSSSSSSEVAVMPKKRGMQVVPQGFAVTGDDVANGRVSNNLLVNVLLKELRLFMKRNTIKGMCIEDRYLGLRSGKS